tara:strand:- start:71 stop:1393 length:1323 start_codon:yes stop_codon:yes gene_type:complete
MDNRSKLDANKIFLDANEILFTGVDAEFTGTVTATDFIGPLDGPIRFEAINRSGADITEGQAIYISGISGNTPEVGLADASDAATMPAFGLAATDAADNLTLEIVTFGSLKHIKTDYAGWALGDTLCISSTTAGALTNVAHGGEANLIQNIGYVERLHSSNGTIKVGGAGRTNATPNLDDGHVFIGNASNQSAPRALAIADTVGLQAALDAKNSYPDADAIKVGHLTITQAVDLDTLESNVATNNAKTTYPPADGAKVGFISVTQDVDLDAMENAINNNSTAITLNTAKISYSTAASDAVALNTAKNSYPSADAVAVAALPTGLSGFEGRIAVLEAKMEFIPKAFGRFTTVASPALLGTSYNVASISRAGAGQYSVAIDTDLTTANYTVLISYEDSTATIQIASTNSHATTGFNIGLRDGANALSDASESVSFAIYENNT